MASRVRKRSSRKQEILMFAPNSRVVSLFFLYRNVALYYVSQDFRRGTWVSVTVKERTSKMSHWGAWKCSRFRNSGSLFQSFPYALCRGAGSRPQWGGVRDSEVSARRELTVYAYAVLASGICIPVNRYNSPGHVSRNLRMSSEESKTHMTTLKYYGTHHRHCLK